MSEAIIVTIAYTVRPEKREEFMQLITGLIASVNGLASGVKMSLYETEGESNNFVEIYACDSIEHFDSLEDDVDDASRESIAKIASEFTTTRQSVTTLRRVQK